METQAEDKVSSERPDLDKVLEKITEIAKASATGDYIYRGEPECYDKVSSNLYREYKKHIEAEPLNMMDLQTEIVQEASGYTIEKMDPNLILPELQHYGGKTNLIDFTIDYLVALFFACDGETKKPGRVILLRRQSESDPKAYEVVTPPRTIRRAEAQKSIFVQAEKGFVEPDKVVCIPADLKLALLDYLDKHHGISTQTIYNDLLGFIDKWNIHESAYMAFYKGFDCQKRGEYDKAIAHYTQSIVSNPHNLLAYSNRAAAYRAKGEVDLAIQDCDKAIELNPGALDAYINRGNAYSDKGEVDLAIQDYTTAIALNPEDVEAHYNRALAYYSKDRFDKAIQDYTQAIELNPECRAAYNNRGVVYSRIVEFDKAIQDYTQAIELNPESAEVYNNRAYTCLYQKEWENAKADLTTAKEMGFNIVEFFQNVHESVEAFEAKTRIKLPEDIAALLR